MIATLVLTFLRQRFTSPMRLLFIGVVALFTVSVATGMQTLEPLGQVASTLAMVFAVGAIGQDVASGVLQLTFGRPLRRRDYVLARWLASGLGAFGTYLVLLAVVLALIVARGGTVDGLALGVQAGESLLRAFGTSAVIIGLSALVPGFGDIALYFLLVVSAQMVKGLGEWRQLAWVERTGREILATFSPEVPLAWLHGGAVPWAAIAAYASTVALALAVAVLVVNRKELSYASG